MANRKNFTLTTQTGSALVRTVLCFASLIEDLLREGYDFVLTSRFQSDPLEKRFRQYQQMSGGRFLVGLRDVTSSEKIIEFKSLLKGYLDIDNVKVQNSNDDKRTIRLLSRASIVPSLSIRLQQESSNSYYTLYSEKVKKRRLGNCCKEHLSKTLVPDDSD